MTGYRVGWVAGDEKLVTLFKKIKTNIDSGTPNFIQTAAITALNDETHAEKMREKYRQKRKLILAALDAVGLPRSKSEATFYLWQKTPQNLNSVEFAKLLLVPQAAIVVTPGQWITDNCANGENPGNNYIRFALVPKLEDVIEAAKRINKLKL
jgi:LL-diaminopimelate aminotransferase